MKPWLWNDTIYFNFTSDGRQECRDLAVLHNFTMNVIKNRKKEMIQNQVQIEKSLQQYKKSQELQGVQRKRLAFLDLLLEQHFLQPNNLTELDIREEVDTFMFEGHDTTSLSLIWTLFILGHHPSIQARVHEEIDQIWSGQHNDDDNQPSIINETSSHKQEHNLTTNQLREMKLLEACIKESLRLFPSVPYIARLAAEDIEFNYENDFNSKNNRNNYSSFCIPKGTTMFIFISALQRDAAYFDQPNRFMPERFLSENVHSINDNDNNNDHRITNPFAYVPFSAGPRNCIGQKFALQEEKILLATILRNFRLESIKPFDNILSSPELVLRPKEPINIRFYPRKIVTKNSDS